MRSASMMTVTLVGGENLGDDRGVDDPQPADTFDGADGIDDRPRVSRSAHRRGGGGVAVDGRVGRDDVGEGFVVGDRVAGCQLGRDEGREGRVAGESRG